MYQALQSIMLDSEVEETKDAADKEEVLTVTFHRNTEEAPEVTLKYLHMMILMIVWKSMEPRDFL